MSILRKLFGVSHEKYTAATPDGYGALLQFPKGDKIVGYYKDGVVYTSQLVAIGKYVNSAVWFYEGSMEREGKHIGNSWVVDNEPWLTVLVNTNWGGGEPRWQKVAVVFDSTPDVISPYARVDSMLPHDSSKDVLLTNPEDINGAVAAYVVLRYGWGSYFEEVRRCFEAL